MKNQTQKNLNWTMLGVLIGLFISSMMVLDARADNIDNELNYEIERLFNSVEDEVNEAESYDECILDSEGVCRVETDSVAEEKFKESTPETFEDSKIRRKLKDGTYQEFNGDDFKIVPRKGKRLKVVKDEKRIKPVLIREVIVEVPSNKRNSVSLLVGKTPTGLDIQETATSYKAETEPETDFGLMYQRDMGEKATYRGTIGITVRGAGYLGLGVNF